MWDDIRILKQAYFAVTAVDKNIDYDGHILSHIMDLDKNFITEFIDHIYKTKKHFGIHDSSRDYSFIWKRNDFERVIKLVSERIYNREKEEGSLALTGLVIFFELKGNDKSNIDLIDKQDHYFLNS